MSETCSCAWPWCLRCFFHCILFPCRTTACHGPQTLWSHVCGSSGKPVTGFSHITYALVVYTSGDTVGIQPLFVFASDWEEGSRLCLSILKVSCRKGLFLIVSWGCVCFVFADLPECMQMVPGTTVAVRAHINLFGCISVCTVFQLMSA